LTSSHDAKVPLGMEYRLERGKDPWRAPETLQLNSRDKEREKGSEVKRD